jgi:acyl-CoA reductase-like NAD-dependent aldehyde dehydrogenase
MATGATLDHDPDATVHDPRAARDRRAPRSTTRRRRRGGRRARPRSPSWAALPVRERGRLVKRARKAMVRVRARVIDLLERETGKARFDVVGELMGVVHGHRHLARRAPRWLRTRAREHASALREARLVVYKPRGVVGIISPWNAPLNLALGDAVPALLAGNAVVVKPSELTPLAVRRAVEAMNRVLPGGVLQVVIGVGDTGAALVDHVDMICVTGSPETGRG